VILKTPASLYWSMTRACNLRCSFCLLDCGEAVPGESARVRMACARRIAGARVMKVVLTGGEPTLVPDLPDIIAVLKSGAQRVVLTTNGTRITRAKLAEWSAAGLDALQISLNGSSASVNDALMGAGSFASITRALRDAARLGFPYSVKVTLLNENRGDIKTLLEMPEVRSAREILIQEVVPMGRAARRIRPPLAMTETALASAERVIHDTAMSLGLRVEFTSLTLAYRRNGHPPYCTMGAPDAVHALLSETGELVPCTYALSWGIHNNILAKGLEEAWNDFELLPGQVPVSKPAGACADCGDWGECRGGCRALNYAITGRHGEPYALCPRVRTLTAAA
jgi:radical SAM protein with 4Fe4S-binding SPASM domain